MSQDYYFESPVFMAVLIIGTILLLPIMLVIRVVRWFLGLFMRDYR